MQDLIVSGVKALLRILLRLYFAELRHTKRDIPKEGPLVFLANHQNALLDALLIAAFNRRKTFFPFYIFLVYDLFIEFEMEERNWR
jgi:1-acyl-sn-glycerol-3-phosphate acyltransferase